MASAIFTGSPSRNLTNLHNLAAKLSGYAVLVGVSSWVQRILATKPMPSQARLDDDRLDAKLGDFLAHDSAADRTSGVIRWNRSGGCAPPALPLKGSVPLLFFARIAGRNTR